MIPKVIHYCWFGNNPKSNEILGCIESWKKTNPDFEIKEWNESNFPYTAFEFSRKMYEEERWAFVADYARLFVLEKYGGFYLDTDMLLLKPLSPFLPYSCVLGEEAPGVISAGMIGAEKNHPLISRCKDFYDNHPNELITIPRVLTQIYKEYKDKESIQVYPEKTFYPFTSENIKEYKGQDLGDEVFGVHLWHYSWGHPLNRFFKKIGVHSAGKQLVEKLGIKATLKKLFGFV